MEPATISAAAPVVSVERSGVTAQALPKTQATQRWIVALSALVGFLALVATTLGIFTGIGQKHHTFLTLRGEHVLIQGGGLYGFESVSGAAQAIGQDAVTLLVGIPLLISATILASRGSLRGRVLRAGVLWYFTYTYLLMAFGAAYNPVFLVYVTLFSASLFAFVLSLLAIDVQRLPAQFSPRFARRAVAGVMIGIGVMLALLWLGRIVPALVAGSTPPGLESYSTLFVQAGDLSLVVPLAILTGALLLRRQPVSYLLAGVILIKGATLGLALMAMIATMALAGVQIVLLEVVFFGLVTAICLIGTIHLFTCMSGERAPTTA
ncbi:MAG TPA: hypothetical protein VF792_10365 [Ktedonobacterales bacterium]